jgi:hypothetical protein
MLHIVEEPVLWRKTEKVRVNQEGALPQEGCKRLGSVLEEARVLPFFCFTSTGKLILHY